jgi:hypothetical protein
MNSFEIASNFVTLSFAASTAVLILIAQIIISLVIITPEENTI